MRNEPHSVPLTLTHTYRIAEVASSWIASAAERARALRQHRPDLCCESSATCRMI
jgi:hypothetical protein